MLIIYRPDCFIALISSGIKINFVRAIRNDVAAVCDDVSVGWQQLPVIANGVKQSVDCICIMFKLYRPDCFIAPYFLRDKKKSREGDSQRRRGGLR